MRVMGDQKTEIISDTTEWCWLCEKMAPKGRTGLQLTEMLGQVFQVSGHCTHDPEKMRK